MRIEKVEEKLIELKGKDHPVLNDFLSANSPEEKLRIAKDYLNEAEEWIRQCQSDFFYWIYERGRMLAEILVAIAQARKNGKTEIPDFPKSYYELDNWLKVVQGQ